MWVTTRRGGFCSRGFCVAIRAQRWMLVESEISPSRPWWLTTALRSRGFDWSPGWGASVARGVIEQLAILPLLRWHNGDRG